MSEFQRMNPEVKAKWIDRLVNGNLPQTKSSLAKAKRDGTPTGFCCLGVLCELAVEAGVIPKPVVKKVDLGDGTGFVLSYDDNDSFLPQKVSEWAGISGSMGRFEKPLPYEDDGRDYDLTDLNDRGKKFSTIAKVIEREF